MNETILLIEDNESIIMGLEYLLTEEQYTFLAAKTKKEAQDLLASRQVDLVLLDVSLPDGNGFDLCRKIKEHDIAPVIFLTAKDEEKDVVLGFDLGADDYVTKPFPMSVFQKKVSALLARIRKQSGGDFYNDGNLFINFTEMTATRGGESISFTPMEYRLLKVLTKNPQIVLTRQVLLEKLWDIDGNFVDEHALTSTISRVRSKIENPDHAYIKTVYGMGYMWIGGGNK